MVAFDVENPATSDRQSLVSPKKTSKARPLCILSTGLIFLSLGTFAGLFVPKYIEKKIIDASVVCGSDDPDYEGWITNTGKDAVPKFRDFFVYDIENAVEYATGVTDVPKVHMKGPFISRCYTSSFDIDFEGATVSYRDYTYCDWQPDNERNVEDLAEYFDATSPKTITHMNAGYNKVLGMTMSEGGVFLNAAGCSTEQIMNIAKLTDPTVMLPCDWSTQSPVNPATKEACGCCVPGAGTTSSTAARDQLFAGLTTMGADALYAGASVAGSQVIMPCEMLSVPQDLGSGTANDAYPANKIAMQVSKLAGWDGGLATDLTLSTTAANIPVPIFTPQIVSKTVNEIAFGYPSAILGYFLSKAVTAADAVALLKGTVANLLPPGTPALTDAQAKAYNLNNVAALPGQTLGRTTADVAEVCTKKCNLGAAFNVADIPNTLILGIATASCSGYAAPAADQPDHLKYLGGINCMPFTGTFSANVAVMAERFSADAAAAAASAQTGTTVDPVYANEVPTCASDLGVGSTGATLTTSFNYDFMKFNAFLAAGGSGATLDADLCCLADGTHSTLGDLTGIGCVAHFSGFLNSRNVYDEAEKTKVDDLGNKITVPGLVSMYLPGKEPQKKVTQDTGCNKDDAIGTNVNEILKWENKDAYDAYMPPTATAMGLPGKSLLPTPADVTLFATGKDATGAPATSIPVSGNNGGTQIKATGLSTRKWASKTFNDGEKSVASFDVYISQMYQPVKISFTGVEPLYGIDLMRYSPAKDILATSEANAKKGLGIIDGSAVGTYSYGFPVLLSFPNFLHSEDENFYTNIELYKDYDGAKKLNPADKLDKAKVTAMENDYSVIVDIEPTTGKAMNGHLRLMLSVYAWGCDPTNPASPDCALFHNLALAPNNGMPYAKSAANVLTPKMKGEVFLPTFWYDENSKIPEESAGLFVKMGEQMQYVDAAAVVFGMIGGTMILFGVFGLFCGKK
mmetsp:Transcript_23531/g.49004  ORF Transcript_23531/g.49004 Transcript_23531/m.49004 type:complete len:969 (-) Transcript_23531:97-3003(-)